jgi:hypothetical protein
MMQVRKLARKALEFLKLDVGVKLFITLLKKGISFRHSRGRYAEMARG